MEFLNHTPFPAVAFEGLTPDGQPFHVLALKQTYRFDADGALSFDDEQQPLLERDQYTGPLNESAVAAESDYCHFKPRCDVLVTGRAHPPSGIRSTHFDVRLVVRRPEQPVPIPPRPEPANALFGLTPTELVQWERAVAQARATPPRSEVLLDKTLRVHGERWLKRKLWPVRALQSLLRLGSFGLLKPNPWRLTEAARVSPIALTAEYAFGGQAKVHIGDASPRKVPKRHYVPNVEYQRLKEHHQATGENPLLAHAQWDANHVGRGFVTHWFLKATRPRQLPAPLIEYPNQPFTADQFWQVAQGAVQVADAAAPKTASLDVVQKVWLPRRNLLGTVDQAFIRSEAPLPQDFDFAYWNAAASDQQCPRLKGNEVLQLTHLTPEGGLRLTLPGHEVYAFARYDNDEIQNLPMYIDTVLIDTEQRRLMLTWRLAVTKGEAAITTLEACMSDKEAVAAYQAALQNISQTLGIPEAELLNG